MWADAQQVARDSDARRINAPGLTPRRTFPPPAPVHVRTHRRSPQLVRAPTRRQRPPRERHCHAHNHAQTPTSGRARPNGLARPDHRRNCPDDPRAAHHRRHGFNTIERCRSPARRPIRPRCRRDRPQRVRRRSGAVADRRIVARHRERWQRRRLRIHRSPVRDVVEHPAVDQQLDGRRVLRDGGRRRRRHRRSATRPRRMGRRPRWPGPPRSWRRSAATGSCRTASMRAAPTTRHRVSGSSRRCSVAANTPVDDTWPSASA